MRVLIPTLALLAGLTAGASASDDDLWGQGFGITGTNNIVYASTTFEGDLILGGAFTELSSMAAERVVRWDGDRVRPMADGLDGTVYALAVWNSELYATGFFDASGTTGMDYLAKWNGSSWEEVGGGLGSFGYALAVWNGKLIVGGSFSEVGSGDGLVQAGGVAMWDGTDWTSLNTGFVGSVRSLLVDSGDLYAGGTFPETSGGGPGGGGNLARYDGADWHPVGGGMTRNGAASGVSVDEMTMHDGDLLVSGVFDRAGGTAAEGMARWNGSTWLTEPSIPSGAARVSALGSKGGDLYCGDIQGNLFRRIPTGWEIVFEPLRNWSMEHIGSWGPYLVAGGNFNRVGSYGVHNVFLLDGSDVRTIGKGWGLDGWVSSFGFWDSKLLVLGGFGSAGAVQGTSMAAMWDGGAWTGFGTHLVDQFDSASSMAVWEGDLLVGGGFAEMGGVPAANIARWDGTSWSQFGPGLPSSVGLLHVYDGDLYAATFLENALSVVRWDGIDWVAIASITRAAFSPTAHKFLEYDGKLLLGGRFDEVDGVTVNGLASYDGVTWSDFDGGVSGSNSRIRDLVIHDGDLYAGGIFSQAGSTAASNIARWDGTGWTPLGAGLGGFSCNGLASMNGDLYATGDFDLAGGLPAAHIARWDGSDWHALGSGLGNIGDELAVFQDRLYVGGSFTDAGGQPAWRFTSWGGGATGNPAWESAFSMLPSAPNPFQRRTTLSYELPRTTQVSIDVFDVRGRRVRSVNAGEQTSGRHDFTWNGKDSRGETVANGTYFIALRAGDRTYRSKVTVVR